MGTQILCFVLRVVTIVLANAILFKLYNIDIAGIAVVCISAMIWGLIGFFEGKLSEEK